MPIVNSKNLSMPLSGEQLKNFFKQHDTNGDGLLDRDELKAAFKGLGAVLPGWRAGRCMHHADGDGDGFISENELTKLVQYAIQIGYTVK